MTEEPLISETNISSSAGTDLFVAVNSRAVGDNLFCIRNEKDVAARVSE